MTREWKAERLQLQAQYEFGNKYRKRLQGARKKIRSFELKENLWNVQTGHYMIKRKVLGNDEEKSRNQTELKRSNGWLKKFLPRGFVFRKTIVSS